MVNKAQNYSLDFSDTYLASIDLHFEVGGHFHHDKEMQTQRSQRKEILKARIYACFFRQSTGNISLSMWSTWKQWSRFNNLIYYQWCQSQLNIPHTYKFHLIILLLLHFMTPWSWNRLVQRFHLILCHPESQQHLTCSKLQHVISLL